MSYLKVVNLGLGNCLDFKKTSGSGVDWDKLECTIATVSSDGFVGLISDGTRVSCVPINNDENAYILAAIDDANDNYGDTVSAEIIDSDAYDTLKADYEETNTSDDSE